MSVQRYDLGTEYKSGVGFPSIVRKDDGRYVSYDDYAMLVMHNELLSLQLRMLARQRPSSGK